MGLLLGVDMMVFHSVAPNILYLGCFRAKRSMEQSKIKRESDAHRESR